jgi:hypothetical protein
MNRWLVFYKRRGSCRRQREEAKHLMNRLVLREKNVDASIITSETPKEVFGRGRSCIRSTDGTNGASIRAIVRQRDPTTI